MVGRYGLAPADPFELQRRFRLGDAPFVEPRYNIAPTQPVAALPAGTDRLILLRWGTRSSRLVINARSETAAQLPLFARSLRHRRAIIPARFYYEWRNEPAGKQPYAFSHHAGDLLAFAGLIVDDTVVICTTPPNDLAASLHNWMPAILDGDAEAIWNDAAITDARVLTACLRPCAEDLLMMRQASRLVNRVANDGPELLVPDDPT